MANAPFGEAILSTSAETLQINRSLCKLLGYTDEELIGKDFRSCQPDRGSPQVCTLGCLSSAAATASVAQRFRVPALPQNRRGGSHVERATRGNYPTGSATKHHPRPSLWYHVGIIAE